MAWSSVCQILGIRHLLCLETNYIYIILSVLSGVNCAFASYASVYMCPTGIHDEFVKNCSDAMLVDE